MTYQVRCHVRGKMADHVFNVGNPTSILEVAWMKRQEKQRELEEQGDCGEYPRKKVTILCLETAQSF